MPELAASRSGLQAWAGEEEWLCQEFLWGTPGDSFSSLKLFPGDQGQQRLPGWSRGGSKFTSLFKVHDSPVPRLLASKPPGWGQRTYWQRLLNGKVRIPVGTRSYLNIKGQVDKTLFSICFSASQGQSRIWSLWGYWLRPYGFFWCVCG